MNFHAKINKYLNFCAKINIFSDVQKNISMFAPKKIFLVMYYIWIFAPKSLFLLLFRIWRGWGRSKTPLYAFIPRSLCRPMVRLEQTLSHLSSGHWSSVERCCCLSDVTQIWQHSYEQERSFTRIIRSLWKLWKWQQQQR